MTLRCGRIEYTNDLPIYAAFDAGAIDVSRHAARRRAGAA